MVTAGPNFDKKLQSVFSQENLGIQFGIIQLLTSTGAALIDATSLTIMALSPSPYCLSGQLSADGWHSSFVVDPGHGLQAILAL